MSLGSSRARHRRSRSVRPLAGHLRRPSVVCSLAVVALGASVTVQAGQASTATAPRAMAAASTAGLPLHSGLLSPSEAFSGTAGGAPALSLAALLQEGPELTVVAAASETYRAGSSPLDPTSVPARLFTGELPVNTIVAPAQPVVIGEGGKFGWRTAPDLGVREFHNGSDISAPTGTPVVAAAEGTVTAVFWDVWGGNRVEVSHADGLRTTYSHLEDVMVEVGDELAASQRLGSVGATGIRVTGSHLHFETWVNGAAVDPESFDWVTDTGILPATADPYSLSAQAPSAQEAADILAAIEARLAQTVVQPMAAPTSPARTAVRPPAAEATPERQPKKTEPVRETAAQPARAPRTQPPARAEIRTTETEKPATPKPAPKPGPTAEPAPVRAPELPTAPVTAPAPAPTAGPVQPLPAPGTPTVTAPAPAQPVTPSPSPSVPVPAEEGPSEEELVADAQRTYASPTADTDADGIVDVEDIDLDGDGIENWLDADLDGDGIENVDETAPEEVWAPAAAELRP